MQNFENRVALITGANRGLGFEIARQLAARHITVLIGARNEKKGKMAAEKLKALGLDADSILIDVTSPTAIQAAIGKIKDERQRLDILVNNAGILVDPQTSILELNPTILQNTLETNAFGPLLLTQSVLSLMKANNYGRIVNISSTLGSLADITNPDSAYGQVLSPAYRLSKIMLNGLTVLLAKELGGWNILINATCPGWVRTDLGGDRAPLSPEQGADTAVWLATLPEGGPTGGFFRERQPISW